MQISTFKYISSAVAYKKRSCDRREKKELKVPFLNAINLKTNVSIEKMDKKLVTSKYIAFVNNKEGASRNDNLERSKDIFLIKKNAVLDKIKFFENNNNEVRSIKNSKCQDKFDFKIKRDNESRKILLEENFKNELDKIYKNHAKASNMIEEKLKGIKIQIRSHAKQKNISCNGFFGACYLDAFIHYKRNFDN
ncbi:hypothetical protein GVAV_002832 [Gurleya vavrai]